MNKTIETLELLSNVSGRLEKEQILKDRATEELKFIFETALNPFFVYGAFDFDDGSNTRDDIPTYKELKNLRENLINKTYTGGAAKDELRRVLLTSNDLARKWLVRTFKKNLNCGVSTKSINKLFDGLIPEFSIGLCESYEDPMIFKIGKWIAEPKYDGNRAIAFVDNNYNIIMVSRNNKPVYNVDLIINELESICKRNKLNNVIFDGELYGKDWNESSSIIRSSKSSVDKTKLFYYIFDMVHGEQWANGVTKKLYERKEEIQSKLIPYIKEYNNIRITPWYEIKSVSDAESVYKTALKDGFEGLVLKEVNAMYPFGRTNGWLKWKPVKTYDVTITGWEPGRPGSKYEKILGAFICDLNGKKVKVGGGFTDDLRIKFWNEKEEMKGKTIEVECQELTKDGSLRFPVFKRVRFDK